MIPLKDAKFRLDFSAIAGLVGGDEAVSAMAAMNVYEGRKWTGWYNSPGCYVVGKKFGRLAASRFWDGLFPGASVDLSVFSGVDGNRGPEFKAVNSGTNIKDTGNVGHLFFKECESLVATKVEGRRTTPMRVAIARLKATPEKQMDPTLRRNYSIVLACLPTLCSLCACIACGLYGDWYCFSMILFGILTGGISSYVIGTGQLTYTHPMPAPGSPKGDGIMMSEAQMVVVIGEEGAVNSVTRGRFSLRFANESGYRRIGVCSMLLKAQFLLQLLIVPQGILVGQAMFLSSVLVSWAYNAFLSLLDEGQIQRDMLLKKVLGQPRVTQYELGTRTSMAIFVLLALHPSDPGELLNELLPNNTNTWRIWKRTILGKLERGETLSFAATDFNGVEEGERKLLETLYEDAEDAYKGFTVNIDEDEYVDNENETRLNTII